MKRPYSDNDTDTGGTDPQRRPWKSSAWIPKDPQGGGSPGPSRGKGTKTPPIQQRWNSPEAERIRCLEQAIESLQRWNSPEARSSMEARLFKLEQIAMSLVANSGFFQSPAKSTKDEKRNRTDHEEKHTIESAQKTASHP